MVKTQKCGNGQNAKCEDGQTKNCENGQNAKMWIQSKLKNVKTVKT